MHKVLITSRSFGEVGTRARRILEEAGIEPCKLEGPFDPERFARELRDADALIIGAHPLEESALRGATRLRIVCKHGAGLDNIDLDLAARYRIAVTNAPGTNADAVADLTMGLMADVARRISQAAAQVEQGRWGQVIGVDVYGKTLGLVGYGAIARRVARRAAGFSMRVLAHDPFVQGPAEPGIELAALDQVLRQSDFLSIHVPLLDSTRHLIGRAELSRMKPGSFLINTSRGGIVDEGALLESLRCGHLGGAALDVLERESADTPLARLDNVVITPHIGMYSVEAIEAVSVICASNVAAALNGGPLSHVAVPLPDRTGDVV